MSYNCQRIWHQPAQPTTTVAYTTMLTPTFRCSNTYLVGAGDSPLCLCEALRHTINTKRCLVKPSCRIH